MREKREDVVRCAGTDHTVENEEGFEYDLCGSKVTSGGGINEIEGQRGRTRKREGSVRSGFKDDTEGTCDCIRFPQSQAQRPTDILYRSIIGIRSSHDGTRYYPSATFRESYESRTYSRYWDEGSVLHANERGQGNVLWTLEERFWAYMRA